ncbi:MAG TPA: glucan biosynthesis protein G [Opitutaceae bacterium]|nr:glucan biosynthesis protein G [Opitutaceae bacterium]
MPVRILFLLSLALLPAVRGVERVSVDHAFVARLARERAAAAYEPGRGEVHEFYRQMNYDTYQRITFRREQALWYDAGLRFRLEFYHPGYLFTRALQMHEITDSHAQPIPFARSLFDFHDIEVPWFSQRGLNYAGFRVLHPLNRADKWDEMISFLGASYYRALGKGHFYGLSGRGLALNAGGPAPEEFPAFTEFWIRKPIPDDQTLHIHALLDGPSVAGAYTFNITPGDETVIETRATLFFRRRVDVVGFAPLSSMFWFGEASPHRYGDFRPEVHDSDGLLVAPDPETRLWRPLLNPPGVWHTDFETTAFTGFGLLQRDRAMINYEDPEARYDARPSVWVEPIGSWPPGRVRLVEIPSNTEYHDNVTAFWVPQNPVEPGEPYELAWRQRWTSAKHFGGPPGWVEATRRTVHDGGPDLTKYVVDFDGGSLASIPAEAAITADVSVSGPAEIRHVQVMRRQDDGRRRLILRLAAKPGGPAVDIRARLMLDQRAISETWTTRWQP